MWLAVIIYAKEFLGGIVIMFKTPGVRIKRVGSLSAGSSR